MKTIALIAAISENGIIGRDGKLPWKLPDDLRLFSNITKTHPVIMGRKSFQSIGKPLKDRLNIILSNDPEFQAEDCVVLNDVEQAINVAGDTSFIIGGAQIYKAALPLCTHFFRTTVNANIVGDTLFPEYD